MCISPLHIPNKNYRSPSLNEFLDLPFASSRFSRYYKDVTSHYIDVPCGSCPECRQARQTHFVQRSLIQSLDYHCIMLTLTYNNEHLPKFTIKTSSGDTEFTYASHHDVQNMFKRIRNDHLLNFGGHRSFKYLCASEYGKRKHRPHFHILLYISVRDSDFINLQNRVVRPSFKLALQDYVLSVVKKTWCKNIGTKKKPIYIPLCNYVRRGNKSSYQCEYVQQKKTTGSAENDVAFYVSKYTLKFDKYQNYLWNKLRSAFDDITNLDELQDTLSYIPHYNHKSLNFNQLWNIIRPKIICSKFYGFSSQEQIQYIQNCISRSHINAALYPQFYNPTTGEHFGLSSYFQKKSLSPEDIFRFYDRLPDERKLSDTDISHLPDFRYTSYRSWQSHIDNKNSQYRRICSSLQEKYSRVQFDEIPESIPYDNFYDMSPNCDFENKHTYIPPVANIPKNYEFPLIFIDE